MNSYQIITAGEKHRSIIIKMLEKENLPAADLPQVLENFFLAVVDKHILGIVGLEAYGSFGLLRSMAVVQPYRGRGIAAALVNHLENLAKLQGLQSIFLLTETAEAYFKKKGYRRISRQAVPPAVQAASEFSSVCPASATVMQKDLA